MTLAAAGSASNKCRRRDQMNTNRPVPDRPNGNSNMEMVLMRVYLLDADTASGWNASFQRIYIVGRYSSGMIPERSDARPHDPTPDAGMRRIAQRPRMRQHSVCTFVDTHQEQAWNAR